MPRVARGAGASSLPIQELQLATLVERTPDGPEWLHDGRLVYAGKVGTGFSMKVLAELYQSLAAIEQPASPFDPPPTKTLTGPRHWVAPELVAEISFAEWTQDRRLRHPSFQGLRLDKSPREVVRELPAK